MFFSTKIRFRSSKYSSTKYWVEWYLPNYWIRNDVWWFEVWGLRWAVQFSGCIISYIQSCPGNQHIQYSKTSWPVTSFVYLTPHTSIYREILKWSACLFVVHVMLGLSWKWNMKINIPAWDQTLGMLVSDLVAITFQLSTGWGSLKLYIINYYINFNWTNLTCLHLHSTT